MAAKVLLSCIACGIVVEAIIGHPQPHIEVPDYRAAIELHTVMHSNASLAVSGTFSTTTT